MHQNDGYMPHDSEWTHANKEMRVLRVCKTIKVCPHIIKYLSVTNRLPLNVLFFIKHILHVGLNRHQRSKKLVKKSHIYIYI